MKKLLTIITVILLAKNAYSDQTPQNFTVTWPGNVSTTITWNRTPPYRVDFICPSGTPRAGYRNQLRFQENWTYQGRRYFFYSGISHLTQKFYENLDEFKNAIQQVCNCTSGDASCA